MITTEIMEVTPKIAATWLGRANTSNRRLRPHAAASLAADMKAGRWQLNGDAIRFDCNGVLLDGQHRLAACVSANVPFQTVVICGLDPTSQMNMDRGASRSFSDYLTLQYGTPHSTSVATLTKASLLYQLSGGRPGFEYVPIRSKGGYARQPTIAELDEWYQSHQATISEAVQTIKYHSRRSSVSIPVGQVSAIGFGAVHAGMASDFGEFMQLLYLGGATEPTDPAHLLRERYIKWQITGHSPTLTIRRVMTIYVWNKWIAGEAVRNLRTSHNIEMMVRDQDGDVIFPLEASAPDGSP